jgi:GT2 family glycosyltransferase
MQAFQHAGARVSSNQVPWLSVVIPVHNGERWLGETLDSVAIQNEAGIECIVIDSSPGEGTLDLVRSYGERLNLRIFKRTDLDNWRTKTNFGFSEARGAFVCMLHQDDFWLPGRIAALKRWIAQRPDAAMFLHPSYFVNENGKRLGLWSCPLPGGDAPVQPLMMIERLLVQNFISVPAPAIRRDVFLAVGGIDETLWYTGDWDLYLKIAAAGPVLYRDDALTCFRIHGQSMTMTGSRDSSVFATQMMTVMQKHVGRLDEPVRSRILKLALASIRMNTGLAEANGGSFKPLLGAMASLAALGPAAWAQYMRDSRIVERLTPRLRARFSGGL